MDENEKGKQDQGLPFETRSYHLILSERVLGTMNFGNRGVFGAYLLDFLD